MPAHTVHRCNILLVEDHADLRDFFSVALQRMGYDVVAVSDGVEGLEAMERQTFCLVLTDWRMPSMTGGTFIQVVRRRPGGATLPIIMISAVGTQESAIATGATAYLRKPVTVPMLEEVLAIHLHG